MVREGIEAMAGLKVPQAHEEKVANLAGFLKVVAEWQACQETSGGEDGFLSQLWYRGVNEQFTSLVPGVYREEFTARARRLRKDGDDEEKRLHLEREMLAQFRSAGAAFLNRESVVEIYFAAQHFGMPTRLLDWSTNPLAALFFACDGKLDRDGVVYAMDARRVIPPGAMRSDAERLYQAVMTMRHPFVEDAVKVSFWAEPKVGRHPHILPVRPDIVPGRIGQQSSCFTLHMHRADMTENSTMIAITIEAASKAHVRSALHGVNINEFTTYYDLDHLSKEIRRGWGLP